MIRSIDTTASRAGNEDREYRLSPEVMLLVLQDGTARLVDLEADGQIRALSPTATLLLQQTLEHGAATAGSLLSRRFGVPAERIDADLEHLLRDLESARVIVRKSAQPTPRRLPHRTSALFRLLLALILRVPHLRFQAWGLIILAPAMFARLGWSSTLALCRRSLPGAAYPSPRDAAAIAALLRDLGARHPFSIDCKTRALAGWLLCRRAGVPASLVIGLQLFPLVSHCWCEVDGVPLADDPERCRRYTPLLRYEE